MYCRHVEAANSGLGSDTLWGWHLETYGLWQLFWPQHLPPTMVMSGSTELAGESCPSSERPQENTSELPKYWRGSLSFRLFANTFLHYYVFPLLANIKCASSLILCYRGCMGVGLFHLQNPLDIIRCLLKATSALMYCGGVALRSRHGLHTQGIMEDAMRPQQPGWQAGEQLTVTVKI